MQYFDSSDLEIFPFADLFHFVFEIEIAQVSSPDPCARIHRFLAVFKIVEKQNV